MLEAAAASGRSLMIGQCLRFFPEYMCLKELLKDGTYGRAVSAVFRRMSAPPVWSWENWLMDKTLSGGCLLDMHVHDIDISRYLFGEPEAVSCVTGDVYSGADIVHSRLFYPGLSVLAIGDWSQEGAPFTADYRVALEKATVVCESGVVTVYPRGGTPFTPELCQTGGYEGEIEYFVDLIENGAQNGKNPPESAANTVKLMETLQESAKQDGGKLPYRPVFQ